MVAVKFSPVGNGVNFIPNTGLIANGYKLFFYSAGTTTKLDTYTTSAGSVANANPVVLDTYGFPSSGGNRVQIWLQEGESYKVVIASGSDTDPPASGITLADGITGVNDITNLVTEWFEYGGTPSYVSSTSFTVATNQTALFHVGRRLKSTVSGGTAYSTITATSYSAPNTTVTVVNDSTALDAGLSLVEYGILSANGSNPSLPRFLAPDGSSAVTQPAQDNSTKLATTAYVDLYSSIGKQDFRLSLVSGDPIGDGLTSGATKSTIYAVPFIGNKISLYNGTGWRTYSSNEFSLSLASTASNTAYDVFCYQSSNVPTLEILAWTSTAARATNLTTQDGIFVKSGDATRRYLGSFLAVSGGGGTLNMYSSRTLYNFYHRIQMMGQNDYNNSTSHTYTTATWRKFDNQSSAGSLKFFIGYLTTTMCQARGISHASNSTASVQRGIGLGINAASVPSGGIPTASGAGNVVTSMSAMANFSLALGLNTIYLFEYSEATGTTTWYSDSSIDRSTLIQCPMEM